MICKFKIQSTSVLQTHVFSDNVWTNWTPTNASVTPDLLDLNATKVSSLIQNHSFLIRL